MGIANSPRGRAPRTGIVLVTHAPLGSAFRAAVEAIHGARLPLAVLDFEPDMNRAQAREAALALAAAQECAEWLILTDLPGMNSPGVIAQEICVALGCERARLLGGLNMPMLLTALEHLHVEVGATALAAQRAGRCGVIADVMEGGESCGVY